MAAAKTTHFRGVCWEKQKRKWKVQIRIDGKQTTLGTFVDEEAAARAYDKAAAPLGRPLNFPAAPNGDVSAVMCGGGGASHFKGVSWDKSVRMWVAMIKIDGKRNRLGNFDDEQAAARAYDEAAAPVRRPLNFPAAAGLMCSLARSLLKSHFKGVSWDKKDGNWKAKIKNDGKTTILGLFEDEEAAASAYDKAAAPLGRPLNFPAVVGAVSAAKGGHDGGPSQFKGVSWHKHSRKWMATIRIDGKHTHLGCFDDEEAAARAYDEAAAKRATSAVKGGVGCSSNFTGVSWDKRDTKWRVTINIDCRASSLGYFADEEAAARAYDKAAAPLGRLLNFPAAAEGDVSAVMCGGGGSSNKPKKRPHSEVEVSASPSGLTASSSKKHAAI